MVIEEGMSIETVGNGTTLWWGEETDHEFEKRKDDSRRNNIK